MRKSIDTYIMSIVNENEKYIVTGDYNSIADYIICVSDSLNFGWYEFFDDDELGENGTPSDEQIEEVKTYLNKYYDFFPSRVFYGALATSNAEPIFVEDDEVVDDIIKSAKAKHFTEVTEKDFADAMAKLNLTKDNDVKEIYTNGEYIICFEGDYTQS